ncbi:hypothetical protein HU200_024379 [Digitaria exilis]|uniref:Dof zinc finger protein n=1 Tax=Digitaria exilis TaxID=1010633 RepID=A0A835C213_9POAL|nr:hypothetical protein HU200_024379 [Digitaria exilis]
MLSPHCDDSVLMPYAASASAARRAVLLDHRRYYRPPSVETAPNCPRCDSPNTKFCYYNNYSLSQPRYFCKGCRRYWTKGGSLRNVPVGGGCRKNRRGKPVVRAMPPVVDTASATGSGGAAAAFSRRSSSSFPGQLRPDQLLEGMVGSPVGLCQPVNAADKPVDGSSSIDLALLYAKFLNHHQPAAVEQHSLDSMSGSSSSDMSPNVPPRPEHHPFATDGFGELSVAARADPRAAAQQCPDDARTEAVLGELSFSVDQSCYDSLGLPTDDGDDLILPSTWHAEAKYEPFDPLPEDAMSLHGGISGGDDVWSSALACQGLEAALCRP